MKSIISIAIDVDYRGDGPIHELDEWDEPAWGNLLEELRRDGYLEEGSTEVTIEIRERRRAPRERDAGLREAGTDPSDPRADGDAQPPGGGELTDVVAGQLHLLAEPPEELDGGEVEGVERADRDRKRLQRPIEDR